MDHPGEKDPPKATADDITREPVRLADIRELAGAFVEERALMHIGSLKGEFQDRPLESIIKHFLDSEDTSAGEVDTSPSPLVRLKTAKDVRLFVYDRNKDAHILNANDSHVTFDRVELERVPSPPKGYAYKGGAARLALLSLLGEPVGRRAARDLDLVRIGRTATERDDKLSQKYMPDDFKMGYGVELAPSLCRYLDTRDITINEILYFDHKIVASLRAVEDTVNGIIRPTEHVKNADGSLPGNIVAKMLRFQAEAAVEGRRLSVVDVPENQEVSAFDLALHLDRALGRGTRVAESYLKNCLECGYLCREKTDGGRIAPVIDYLNEESSVGLKKFTNLAGQSNQRQVPLHQRMKQRSKRSHTQNKRKSKA